MVQERGSQTYRIKSIGDVLKRKNQRLNVLRPSDPNYWKNLEWIPYVFSEKNIVQNVKLIE